MIDMMKLVLATVLSLFRRRVRLEAEIVVLRHQLNILRRSAPQRLQLSNIDRLLLVWPHRLCPSVLGAIRLVRPETICTLAPPRLPRLLAVALPERAWPA